jgi:hypothetical protein
MLYVISWPGAIQKGGSFARCTDIYGSGVGVAGSVNCWPICRIDRGDMVGFSASSWSMVMPNSTAMRERLSPGLTTYIAGAGTGEGVGVSNGVDVGITMGVLVSVGVGCAEGRVVAVGVEAGVRVIVAVGWAADNSVGVFVGVVWSAVAVSVGVFVGIVD